MGSGGKRRLGLGQQSQQKKLKPEENEDKEETPQAQLEIEIEEGDLDDELVQLHGLWKNYFESERDDELLLNAVVHECDRLLRDADKDEQVRKAVQSDVFHAVYALALAHLTAFKAGEEGRSEEERAANVAAFFDNALERVELGKAQFASSSRLDLVKAHILLHRVPLQYISKLDKESEGEPLHVLVDEALQAYKADADAELAYDTLQALYDLLDIAANFGHEDAIEEGLDSDDEEEEREISQIDLSDSHPLKTLRDAVPRHLQWLSERAAELAQGASAPLKAKRAHRLAGEVLLKLAQEPATEYLELVYKDDDAPETAEPPAAARDVQARAVAATQRAVDALQLAMLDDEPETWAQLAEAQISLGNLLDNGSPEQERVYAEAEQLLKRANRAAKGRYQDVLDALA